MIQILFKITTILLQILVTKITAHLPIITPITDILANPIIITIAITIILLHTSPTNNSYNFLNHSNNVFLQTPNTSQGNSIRAESVSVELISYTKIQILSHPLVENDNVPPCTQ